MSFPRKRESRATATSLALDPRFRGGDSPREMRKQQAFDLILAPMRDRVRGPAALGLDPGAGADESVADKRVRRDAAPRSSRVLEISDLRIEREIEGGSRGAA